MHIYSIYHRWYAEFMPCFRMLYIVKLKVCKGSYQFR